MLMRVGEGGRELGRGCWFGRSRTSELSLLHTLPPSGNHGSLRTRWEELHIRVR